MFHLHIRGGTTEDIRDAVGALKSKALVTGPNQVRIDRVQVAGNWQMVLVRVLRALMEANRTPASSAAG